MESSVVVQVENLSKKYKLYNKASDRLKEALLPWAKNCHKEFYALKDINFQIRQGESIGIVGKNGSGKSTLLKILTGVLSPTSGNVLINGKVSALLELGAGFNGEYSGLENIYLTGTIMGYTREEMEKKVPEIIEFADIGDFIYQPVKTYSSGMYVRLAFAVSINVDPDILIIDEALSVGDIRFQRKCFRKIEEFKKTKTFILVSHDLSTVTKFCDRVIWINEGEMKKEGDPVEITNEFRAFMIEAKFTEGQKEEKINIIKTNKDFENIPADVDTMGDGKATFEGYLLLNENEEKIVTLPAGGKAQLWLKIQANEDIEDAIIGFTLRNRLGDIVCQTNSFVLNQHFDMRAGGEYIAKFKMEVPKLLDGYYTISPAVASGSQSYHVQHSWIFDAIVVEVINKNEINLEGIVYIDNTKFEIEG